MDCYLPQRIVARIVEDKVAQNGKCALPAELVCAGKGPQKGKIYCLYVCMYVCMCVSISIVPFSIVIQQLKDPGIIVIILQYSIPCREHTQGAGELCELCG